MGNTESNESNAALIKKKKNKSNAAGSSEEYSARRRRENTATVVRAATAVAAVAAAGWAVTKLLSSSASEEDEKTNDKGKSMVAVGTSSGYRIPRNRFEDSPYDYFPDEKTNERQKMMVAESYQIPSNEFEDSHSDSEDEETDEECPYPYQIKEGLTRRDQQISGKPIRWRFPGYGKLKLNTDGSVKLLIKNKDGSVRYYINPPRAGFGGVIRDERGSLIVGFYGRLKDGCEVLEAKLWGIYKGLEIIRNRKLREVEIESDSKSAIRLIKDDTIYMKSPFKELVEKCKAMTQETGCMLKHTLREGNRVADKLAKGGRDQYDNFFAFTTPPNKSILRSLAKDVASASYY